MARENPDGKGHLFAGLADLTDQLPIARARKNEVAAALMARAVRDGVDGLMEPRFERYRGRAQALIEEIARAEEGDAAAPEGVQVADAGAGDARLILAGGGAVPADIARPDRGSPLSRDTVARTAVRALAATGAVPALLVALLLAASSESAGSETQVLDRALGDGRRVRLCCRKPGSC